MGDGPTVPGVAAVWRGLMEEMLMGWAGKERKDCSFLKKRTKKLLPVLYASGDSATATPKVFCVFSSEKKTF
jgi:hypothetical protein